MYLSHLPRSDGCGCSGGVAAIKIPLHGFGRRNLKKIPSHVVIRYRHLFFFHNWAQLPVGKELIVKHTRLRHFPRFCKIVIRASINKKLTSGCRQVELRKEPLGIVRISGYSWKSPKFYWNSLWHPAPWKRFKFRMQKANLQLWSTLGDS